VWVWGLGWSALWRARDVCSTSGYQARPFSDRVCLDKCMATAQDVDSIKARFESGMHIGNGKAVKTTLVQNLVQRYENSSGKLPSDV
jgi:hypothetical protein